MLAQHFFVPFGSGISPKWDFTSSGKFEGQEDAFVLAKVQGSVPAPTDPSKDVAWVELVNVQGAAADFVFRTDTRGGQPPSSVSPHPILRWSLDWQSHSALAPKTSLSNMFLTTVSPCHTSWRLMFIDSVWAGFFGGSLLHWSVMNRIRSRQTRVRGIVFTRHSHSCMDDRHWYDASLLYICMIVRRYSKNFRIYVLPCFHHSQSMFNAEMLAPNSGKAVGACYSISLSLSPINNSATQYEWHNISRRWSWWEDKDVVPRWLRRFRVDRRSHAQISRGVWENRWDLQIVGTRCFQRRPSASMSCLSFTSSARINQVLILINVPFWSC